MNITTLRDQLTVFEAMPEPKYLIENLIIEKSINIIAAPSNVGKTLLATELYLLFENGGELFHMKVEKRKALYLDLELQSTMFFYRLKKQSKTNGGENLYYSDQQIDISVDEQLEGFINSLKQNNIEVIIVDSYSQLTVGSEENSNSQQAIILSQLFKIKNAGITLILLHHTRKEATNNNLSINSLRGGSVIASGADTILMLTRSGKVLNLKQIKDRLQPIESWLDVYFEFTENQEGILKPKELNQDQNIDTTLSAQIINLLKEQPYLSGNQIAEKTKAQRKAISDELTKLKNLDIVQQEPIEPRQGQRVKYFLKHE